MLPYNSKEEEWGRRFCTEQGCWGFSLNFTICGLMPLSKSINCTEPKFPHLKNEEDSSLGGVVRIT